MSGHRVSWPGGADGHETNVIGEPSRLLPVARSAPSFSSPSSLPLFLRPPAGYYCGLGIRRGVVADRILPLTIFQIRRNCPVAVARERRGTKHLKERLEELRGEGSASEVVSERPQHRRRAV